MKKSYLLVIGIILLIILVVCSLFGVFEKKEDNKTNNTINENVNENNNIIDDTTNDIIDDNTEPHEDIELPKDSYMGKLFSKLDLKGEELYNSQEYLKYSKDDGIYFISLKELSEKYNYDISQYKSEDGTICDIENSGILFDTKNKTHIKKKDDKPFAPILSGC